MNNSHLYSNLLHKVETDEYYNEIDLTNRVNVYTCDKAHRIKTKDIDPGVTPFIIVCPYCDEMARSSFYQDIAPEMEPIAEWYRPSIEEFEEYSRNNSHDIQHLLNGGLILRYIATKEPVFKITARGNDYYLEPTIPKPKHHNGRINKVNRKNNKASRKARKQTRR